jgi:HD-like signal output (HDOD) protein
MALSAAVLTTVNSPYYGLTRKVSSIQQAITIAGMKTIIQLIMRLLLRQSFPVANTALMEHFWNDSSRFSLAISQLARELKAAQPDEAQSYGLFRDCGIPAILMNTEHAPPAEDVKALRTLADFHVLDSTSLGVDHVFLGHRLAHSWGLSETLCKAIEHHHHTAGDPAAAGAARESMNLVALGELAEMVTADANGTAPPDEEDQWVISHFKLSHDDFTKVAKDVREFIAGHS